MAGKKTGWAVGFLTSQLVLCLVVLAGATATQAATQKASPQLIPAEYHGSWSIDPTYCNFEGDTLDTELYISADEVGFHAEPHRVKSVKLRKGKVVVRYVKLNDATRVAPKELSLSKDKSMLNDYWHRCPETSAD